MRFDLRWTLPAYLFVLFGCAGPGGTTVPIARIVTPGNTQIPLPPGEWVLLAEDHSEAGTNMGGSTNNSQSVQVMYARLEKGRISELVYANSSAGGPPPGGYVTGADCLSTASNDYVYYQDARSGSPNAVDCVKVTGNWRYGRPGQGAAAFYRAAYEHAEQFGGIPRFGVRVHIAQAHGQRYLNYSAFLPSDQSPAETRSAGWRVGDMPPEHRAYVDGVVAWAKQFADAVRLGTDYRL